MLETLHLGLFCHAIYFYVVAHRGDIAILMEGSWTLLIQVLPTILIAVIVQHIWIWRIWTLNKSAWRTTMAVGMTILSLTGCVLYITWLGRRYPQKKRTDDARDPLYLCSLGFVVLNDSLSNFTLCFLFHRSKNGVRQTNSSLSILMAYALNTGIFTFIGALSTLILVYITPFKFYFIAVNAISTKLYLNSLLSMLNWRQLTRSKARDIRQSATAEYPTVQLTSVFGSGYDSDLCDDCVG